MLLFSRQRRMPRCSGAFLTLILLCLTAGSASAQFVDMRTMAGISPAGDEDGTGADARFNAPTGVAVDAAGNIYVADQQNCFIRKVTPAGVVTRFAGTIFGDSPCGSENGPGDAARFSFANGVATDSAGNVYVADTFNNKIRKITPAGVVSTLAGSGAFGFADGTGAAAQFRSPRGVAVDGAGNVYVADQLNHNIRQVTPGGVVTSVAGAIPSPTPASGSTDGIGSAARFNNPYGVAVDSTGNLYVADSNNHTIRKIAPGGVVTTLAGTAGMSGIVNDTGSAARFFAPRGIAVDAAGTLYVADTNNQRIRQVTAAGVVTTFAGTGVPGGVDGTSATARFNNPEGVTLDAAGVVYVADTTSDTIRRIASGVVTTIAGFGDSLGSADGDEVAARFAYPFGVALDSSRNVYVADRNNHTIRKITPAGLVTTFAGLAGTSGTTDGTGSAARFNSPSAVAVDAAGNVYVADTLNNTIRMISPGGVVTTLAGLAGSSGKLHQLPSSRPSRASRDRAEALTEPATPRDSSIRERSPLTPRAWCISLTVSTTQSAE
jgi:sugar lactone lactonase YvrE